MDPEKYYQAQTEKGLNPILATLLLPLKAWNHWQASVSGKNVIYGFGLYHLPLLASYSRSGTNWIRYIIESISAQPTPGEKRLLTGKNYYIDRAHCAFEVMQSYQKIVLVVRDYRECLLRHHKYIWPDYPDVMTFLTDETIKQPASWYINNIAAFDRFAGNKLLIYYEDLMLEPHITIKQLCQFLSLEPTKTQAFLGDLDFHFDQSVDAYTQKSKTSDTSATRDLRFHAKTKLKPDQIRQFDEFYFSQYPSLANQYLSRYDTRNQ